MDKAIANKIEETLAHQEQQISDLSEMLIVQGQDIVLLKKQLEKLQNKITVMAEDNEGDASPLSSIEQAAHDKPPHY